MKDTSHRVPAPPVRAAVTHTLADGADQAVPEPAVPPAAAEAANAEEANAVRQVPVESVPGAGPAPADTVEGE